MVTFTSQQTESRMQRQAANINRLTPSARDDGRIRPFDT